MTNLKNYGVQELSTEEKTKIEGGDAVTVVLVASSIWAFVTAGVAIIEEYISDNNQVYSDHPNGCLGG